MTTPEEKAEAARRAKEEALRKLKERQGQAAGEKSADVEEAKAGEGPAGGKEEKGGAAGAPAVPDKPISEMTPEEKAAAKAAAVAAAKAKAAAAAKAKAAGAGAGDAGADDEKAKAIAAAKAKAAAAAMAKAKAAGKGDAGAAADAEPKKPSPKQPILDHIVRVITEKLGPDVIEESYVNEMSKHMPTVTVKRDRWLETARLLKNDPELAFDYLSNLLSVDYKEHMESVYYFYSYPKKHSLCVKVKTKDREDTRIASIANIWAAANWHERESYDLMGIVYEGHPDLRRIMLTDDWVGHPLRKDYEQFDEEV